MRENEIKVMKFFALFFFIFVHSLFWLLSSGDAVMSTHSILYNYVTRFPFFALFTPCLPVLAGLVLRYRLADYWVDDRLKNYPLKNMCIECLALVSIETVVGLILWGSKGFFVWDVMKFIAFCFLSIVLLCRISFVLLINVALLVFIMYPALKLKANLLHPFLKGVFFGDDGTHFFWPIFPWFSMLVLGFAIGHIFHSNFKKVWVDRSFLFIGLVTGFYAYFFAPFSWEFKAKSIWGDYLFQPPLKNFISYCSFLALFFYTCSLISPKLQMKKYGIIESYSKGLLWIIIAFTVTAYPLAYVIRNFATELVFFIFPFFVGFFVVFSWGVGYLSIRFLSEHSYTIHYKSDSK